MTCWVCTRSARGYGHFELRFPMGDPRRYPVAWVFCSARCQRAFHRLYVAWAASDPSLEEVFMIDPSEMEQAALRGCLKSFGETAGEIGFDKALGVYSEAEALRVVEAIVTAYTEAMVTAHEAASPTRRAGAVLETFSDDLPWEVA